LKLIYTLTLADYQAAQRLHWRQTLSRRAIGFLLFWCLPALGCSIALLAGKMMGIFLTEFSVRYVLLFGFVLGLLINSVLARIIQKPQMFRKQFERKFCPDQRSGSIEIEDGGVSSAILGTDVVSFQWHTFIGFAQDDKMTLLYLAKNRFLLFPTTAMTPAQRTELNDLVARYLPKRKS